MTRLNIGSGGVLAENWENIDRGDAGQKHILDVRDGLPFPDNCVDYAVAHHVVDMLTWAEIADLFDECRRVLKLNGILRISSADLLGAVRAAEADDIDWFWMVPDGKTTFEKLDYYLTWGGARKSFVTEGLLGRCLEDANFLPVSVRAHATHCPDRTICDLDGRAGESIYIEGIAA